MNRKVGPSMERAVPPLQWRKPSPVPVIVFPFAAGTVTKGEGRGVTAVEHVATVVRSRSLFRGLRCFLDLKPTSSARKGPYRKVGSWQENEEGVYSYW